MISTHSLKWQLFLYIALLMCVLIPFFGYVRYEMTKRDAESDFQARVAGAAQVLSVALREPLWDLDETQVEESVKALSNNLDLLAVRITETGPSQYERLYVRDSSGQLAQMSTATAAQIDAAVKNEFGVQWKDTELARGQLYFTDAVYQAHLRSSLTILVGQMALFGVFILATLYFLVQRYVGQPLYRLRETMSDSDSSALHALVQSLPQNELRLLAERYTGVLADLREHQQHLTEMVLSRTRALSEANEQLEGEVQRRARIEQELIQAREMAEHASEAKTYFLAHMSHELRTPLNGIIGYTQLLQTRDNLDYNTRVEYVAHISSCAGHLLELINRVLDLSKIEQGSMERFDQPFDLQRMLHDVVAVVKPRADSKGVALTSDWPETLPHGVIGDGAKLKQILINLLGNAVKFTEQGEIVLRVRQLDEEQLQFELTDTGTGIADRDLQRIFEPFQQAGSASQQLREGGTGLGLSIARRFVQLLGGELTVSSQVGIGSKFRFSLPMPVTTEAYGGATTRRVHRLLGDKKPRLLVVDDVAHNREILQQLLQQIGFVVDTADGAEEALLKVEQSVPDLVFLDIRMPGMDGISCAKILRTKQAKLPLLAFTASVFDPHLDADIKQWFDGLALKPVDLNEICDQLTRLLNVQFEYSSDDTGKHPVSDQKNLPKAQLDRLTETDFTQLRGWLASGSIARIREFAAQLREQRKDCLDLAEALHGLARTYDIEGLRRLLSP